MARIFLMSCNVTQEPYPVFPLGLSMIAGAARRHGHEVAEWDLLRKGNNLDSAAEAARAFAPDVIGLSLRNIDNIDSVSNVCYVNRYREIVRALKDRLDAPVVIGGSAVSLLPQEMLEATGADYAVAGEGEVTFCRLVDALLERRATPEESERWKEDADSDERPSLPRIWHGLGVIAGDEFQALDRDRKAAEFYLNEGGMLNVQTKRGCPHRCAYCTYPILEGCQYRSRSARDVVAEIEHLRRRHMADYIAFTDSTFNDTEGRYLEIAEEMARKDLGIPWMAFFRPAQFSREEVALLKRAGLASIEWGSDCATDSTLEGMRKDFTWDMVTRSNRLFAEAGIANAHFIIFGGPNETEATVREGLRNLEALERCVVFAFRGVRIYPGAPILARAIEDGIITEGRNLLEPVFYHSPAVSQDFIHRAILESFAGRMDRIYPPVQDLAKIQAFHRMGYRGPIWDLLMGSKDGRRRPGAVV